MMNARWFGWIGGVVCSVLLTMITFLFQVNLIIVLPLGKMPVYFWLAGLLAFFVWVFFGKNVGRKRFNGIYIFVMVFSFAYLNSMFQWSVECCPDDYESMSE